MNEYLENVPVKISVEKLLKTFAFKDYVFVGDVGIIYSETIQEAIDNGIQEINEVYGDEYTNTLAKPRTREWHLGRIIYFINHPEELKDIRIVPFTYRRRSTEKPRIIDGHHRLASALYLYKTGKINEVECIFTGFQNTYDFLIGKKDTCYGVLYT